MPGITGRWLVRENWKPVAGPRITNYNAVSASHAIPEDQTWENADLPAGSSVEGEVLGFARVESGAKLPRCRTLPELVSTVEERGTIVYWEDDWERPDDASVASVFGDDPDPSDEDDGDEDTAEEPQIEDTPVTPDDESEMVAETKQELAELDEDDEDDADPVEAMRELREAKADEYEAMGEVDSGPDAKYSVGISSTAIESEKTYAGDTVYRMKDTANDLDVREDIVYEGRVNNIMEYGVFVSLNNPAGTDVSGLVHRSNLPFARYPSDYQIGDVAYVELIKRTEKGLKFDMVDDEVDHE